MLRKLFTLFVFILLLSGCNSRAFNLSGESENWKAELKVQQSSEFEKQELILRYKGEDVDSVGEIDYTVDSVGGFGKTGATLEENGTLRDGSEANPTNAKVNEDTEVNVKVEWNGNTETFQLTKQ